MSAFKELAIGTSLLLGYVGGAASTEVAEMQLAEKVINGSWISSWDQVNTIFSATSLNHPTEFPVAIVSLIGLFPALFVVGPILAGKLAHVVNKLIPEERTPYRYRGYPASYSPRRDGNYK